MATPSVLPEVPRKHADFIAYVQAHPDTSLPDLLLPFKQYDAKLRQVFAQEPNHAALDDQHLNVVPVFHGQEHALKIRARDLDTESEQEKERYVMQLKDEDRRPDGSPAIVQSLADFQQNFALFCESSLVDMDWSNVVAAGSSVVTSLLPVPEKYKKSKRTLRQYYHEMLAPASDVDLFIYGLSEEDAVKKIIEIEKRIKESILTETTTIRTKNAITIASQYPTRHIQIVLRIYKSVAEILTGFDVDCSCAAYDGKQVWAAPRALTAYMTQVNTIDLTRRSPSYENRLSKYSHRGFEVYWPLLERSRIDPTIFERNFGHTVGLARLLVLERLPSKGEREAYMDQRRRERGRPAVNRYHGYASRDNIKEAHEDEVAEWVNQEDVSDYHTFTIPYGPKYHAKKIEKTLYTKDLLLNAEWNRKDDREVTLHRHPAFFGHAKDVILDCCGFCPKPVTPEEHDVAEEEAKIYVSGEISFIKDDPGRQAIGSFNPITDDDWTEMAYVGNTARLCQAIVDNDLEHVQDWLSQEGADPNSRDHTGRTPLHLAVNSSSAEVVRVLIDHGARLVARLADGRTALHLAAARGAVDIVKMILQKSEENEEDEARKEDVRKRARIAARTAESKKVKDKKFNDSDAEDTDTEMIDVNDSDEDMQSTTTGSFIKIKEEAKQSENAVPEEDEDQPDVYDINVLSWDTKCSPLHLAILNGHRKVVKELVETFGADVLLPIKLLNEHDKSPRGAILTLVLCLSLPLDEAKAMAETLLELGASPAQADPKQTTALHYISSENSELLETLIKHNEPSAKRAINHLAVHGYPYRPSASSPLMSAICRGNTLAALKLLDLGAVSQINFKEWMKSVQAQWDSVSKQNSEHNNTTFKRDIEQPIILAVQQELPGVVLRLLDMGADPNTLTQNTQENMGHHWRSSPLESILDFVRGKIQKLKEFKDAEMPKSPVLELQDGVDYLDGIAPGSYKYFVTKKLLVTAQQSDERRKEEYEKQVKEQSKRQGVAEKKQALLTLANEFERVEEVLVSKGAKPFKELFPDIKDSEGNYNHYNPWVPPPPEPFKVCYNFATHDLEEDTREAYLRLFEAAWEGDLDTMKSLTLATWGPAQNTPLKITTSDMSSQTPFSIAVLRGHYDLARSIVEISFAQYQPPEQEQPKRYRLAEENESDVSEDEDVPMYEEIVDDKFTIENIGELSTQVKSTTSPIAYMSNTCSAWDYYNYVPSDKARLEGIDRRKIPSPDCLTLQSWSVVSNDRTMFSLLLDLNVEWTDKLVKLSVDTSGIPSFAPADFDFAITLGRTELLAEMIKHTGAGMELEALVKKSGVKYREKPKYYQGLSVHGKKRADWVSAARGTFVQSVTEIQAPLLTAAAKGSLQSVEWFLSDSPARHYMDFAEAYKHEKLIAHLNDNAGGFEKVLRTWLGAHRELALHCAVLAPPQPETSKLVRYLVEAMPQSLEAKSIGGYTPLALAFSLRRLEVAKILLEAGADQTVRDAKGCNIIHLLLRPAYSRTVADDEKLLQPFLDIIDERLVPSLLTERCSIEPGSLTPIALWLRTGGSLKVLSTLLKFAAPTNNDHLDMLDGTGNTPLHFLVHTQKQDWIQLILERRPDLLYRENSVGRTAHELAEDAYIAHCVRDSPQLAPRAMLMTNRSAESFLPGHAEVKSSSEHSVWKFCENFMKEHPGKRKLVSLLEANEVVKRLATRQASGCNRRTRRDDFNSDAGSEDGAGAEEVQDEVARRIPLAVDVAL